MNWTHIRDEQPRYGQKIIHIDPPYNGHYTMCMREYYQPHTWEEQMDWSTKYGWPIPDFWWMSAEDFPFPDKENGGMCKECHHFLEPSGICAICAHIKKL